MRRSLTMSFTVLCLVGAFAATDAQAVPTIAFDNTFTSIIPGLTGFSTTGAMMDGLAVDVTFTGGGSDSGTWAGTGGNAGEASGDEWSLSLDGDTFGAPWTFSSKRAIDSLRLSGLDALTVFDTDFTGEGTPDSANGWTWTCFDGACDNAAVTYSYQVAVGAAAPVGDLWQVVHVNFNKGGDGDGVTDFRFIQDTDNDARAQDVPEPGTLLLLGSALTGLALRRRRRG